MPTTTARPAPASEDTCTQTTYTNPATLLDLPVRGGRHLRAASELPDHVLRNPGRSPSWFPTREDYYDGCDVHHHRADRRERDQETKATSYGTSEEFTTESEETFDGYGRVLTALDAKSIATTSQ